MWSSIRRRVDAERVGEALEGRFVQRWEGGCQLAIAAQVVRMTSQNTTRQRRLRRWPSGKSKNSMAGAAKITGIKIQFETQAMVSPPGRDPGSVKSA